MPFTENLAVFFSTDEFAQTATVGAASMPVIFDAAGAQGLGGLVESVGPQAMAKSADVAANAIAHGTAITVGGVGYVVTGIEPDGLGVTTLRLRRAA